MANDSESVIFDYTLCCCCQLLTDEKVTTPKSIDSYVAFEQNINVLYDLNAIPQKIKKYITCLIERGNVAQNLYSSKAQWHNSCVSSVNKQKVEFAKNAAQKRKKREERAKRDSDIRSKHLRSATSTATVHTRVPIKLNASYVRLMMSFEASVNVKTLISLESS